MNNRRGVIINLGKRIDGNHCKSLTAFWNDYVENMLVWFLNSQRVTPDVHTRLMGKYCLLAEKNFTSAHQWVLIEVWLWHYHTSALCPYALVKGWWERERKEGTAEWRQQVPSLFLGRGFVSTTLGKFLSPSCSHRVFVDPSAQLSSIQTPLNLSLHFL